MQATSLPFIVAATAIGMDLGLIGAGLLSVLLFPLAGLVLLRNASRPAVTEPHVHRGGFDVPDPAHR
jgi:hypothetical protein